MKVKWIELEKYYTYETRYPKTEEIVSFNNGETKDTHNMEYACVNKKETHYKEVVKEKELSIFYIAKYWRYYIPKYCIIAAIEDSFKCSVYKLIN